ncbi:hypothetical protein [Litoribacillus peritrichatus]|uniref:Uncharacterized protein n=1 Tax=Litoribacillus peritrichatus TaxID=718191 RepID=A0ABP7M2I1_9GAMM
MRVLALISILLCSMSAFSKEYSEELIEADLNNLFKYALNGSASQLDAKREVVPFAAVVKNDGHVGFLYLPEDNEDVKKMSLIDQASYLRAQLRKTAKDGEIRASSVAMYTLMEVKGVKLQGLSIELEHAANIALYRFIPVSEDRKEEIITIHTENTVSETNIPSVFTDNS